MDHMPPRFRILMEDHLFADGTRGVWVTLNELRPDGDFTRAYVIGEYATVQTTRTGILVMVDGRQRIVGDEIDDRTLRSKDRVGYWKDDDRGRLCPMGCHSQSDTPDSLPSHPVIYHPSVL